MPKIIDATPEEVAEFFISKNKKVITFLGYSKAGYENQEDMLDKAKQILKQADIDNTIVNIGATPDGIGRVYELAKEMGFETTGIVSQKAKDGCEISSYSDTNFYIKDDCWGGYKQGTKELTATSKAMIENSDFIVAIGGGAVSADEFDAAKVLGKDTIFFEAEMNHKLAISNGTSEIVDFKGELYHHLKTK